LNYIYKIITPIICCFFIATASAQDGSSHELGFFAGSASFTTDYGQRNDFQANVGGNVGPIVGLVYYLNFTDYRYKWNQRTNYFQEHFRLRSEFSYMEANLEHFGEYADEDSYAGEQLRAMQGKTQVFNLGAQLEFHIVDIVDFSTRMYKRLRFSPYLSLGLMANFYNPSLTSTLIPDDGNWQEDPSALYPKWAVPGTVDTAADVTGSLTWGIGTRFRLGEYSDLFLETRWQYFFSNWVDGLNDKNDPANKYNDWVFSIQVGYIYYLN
jgi:hypothetical protein